MYFSQDTADAQPVPLDQENGLSTAHMIKDWSRIFLQCFTMTFLSEWGDRSQVTTIVLAAKEVIIANTKLRLNRTYEYKN